MRLLKFVLTVCVSGILLTGICFSEELVPSKGIFNHPYCKQDDWQSWSSALKEDFSPRPLARYIELPPFSPPISFSVDEKSDGYWILLNILSETISQSGHNQFRDRKLRIMVSKDIAMRYHQIWLAALTKVHYPDLNVNRRLILDYSEHFFSAHVDGFGFVSGYMDPRGDDKQADDLLALAKRTIEVLQRNNTAETRAFLLELLLSDFERDLASEAKSVPLTQ